MPLYEYECDVCAHRFELIQKFTDPPPAACPKCGGAVTKLLSSPAIQFKGSGFYLTDYGRSGSKSDSKSDSGSVKSGKNESGSSGGSESKSSDSKSSESKSSDSGSSAKSDSGGSGSSSGDSSSKPAAPAKAD